jgi:hypothetical protein
MMRIEGMTIMDDASYAKAKAKEKIAEHNKNTLSYVFTMMQYMQGAKIEVSIKGLPDSGWTLAPYPCWNFRDFEFRVVS